MGWDPETFIHAFLVWLKKKHYQQKDGETQWAQWWAWVVTPPVAALRARPATTSASVADQYAAMDAAGEV